MAKKVKVCGVERLKLTRNIGIIAHIDAGKTTTTERILYYTGREHRLGSVDDGNTATDFNELEQEKGITIETAAVHCEWTPTDGVTHHINILDTPGHVDFTAEVERSLRVLDGAIGVFCASGGVEAQSETVWRQADKYKVPRIVFVNKLDRLGAEFDTVLDEMRDILGAKPIAIQRNIGLEKDFIGVIDLIEMKAIIWNDDSLGAEFEVKDIPEDMAEMAELYRSELLNKLSDFDDEFAMKFLEEDVSTEDIHAVLRKGTLAGAFNPVLCGASLRNKGVQPLLNAVCRYLPSPLDRPPIEGKTPKRRKKASMNIEDSEDWMVVSREADLEQPFSALVFKTVTDKHNVYYYFRVYSGVLKEGQMIHNLRQGKKERLSKIFLPYANRREQVSEARAGDILVTVGLRYTRTGDTLCETNSPIVFESIEFPDTVVSRAVEPKSSADLDKLIEVLKQVERDDPTFTYSEDPETRQLVISGMGELHLDIVKERIERKHKVSAKFREPRVAYRQALTGKGEGQIKLHRELPNGKIHAAELTVEVSRSPFGARAPQLSIMIEGLDQNKVPRRFWPAIEDGLKGAASGSYNWGYPLIQNYVKVSDGNMDPINSTPEAFAMAASLAFEKAVEAAGVDLLEPIMALEVLSPDERLGDVINDLNRRGAEIASTLPGKSGMSVIKGKAPLAEMFGYADKIRSLTNGRGSVSMEPLDYAVVPESRRPELF